MEPPGARGVEAALVVREAQRELPILYKEVAQAAAEVSLQKAETEAIVVCLARVQLLAQAAEEACLMVALRVTGGTVALVAPEW